MQSYTVQLLKQAPYNGFILSKRRCRFLAREHTTLSCICVQIYKYTNTQIYKHKYTNIQIHKYINTNIPVCSRPSSPLRFRSWRTWLPSAQRLVSSRRTLPPPRKPDTRTHVHTYAHKFRQSHQFIAFLFKKSVIGCNYRQGLYRSLI